MNYDVVIQFFVLLIDYYNDTTELFCDFEQTLCSFRQDKSNSEGFGWRLWKDLSISRRNGKITGPPRGANGTGKKTFVY